MRNKLALLFGILGVVGLLLLCWLASTTPTRIRVEIDGAKLRGFVNGRLVCEADRSTSAALNGKFGLVLQPSEYSQGYRRFRVYDLNGKSLLGESDLSEASLGDWNFRPKQFRTTAGGLRAPPKPSQPTRAIWQKGFEPADHIAIEVDFLKAEDGGILLGQGEQFDVILFAVRPRWNDVFFSEWKQSGASRVLQSQRYVPDAGSTLLAIGYRLLDNILASVLIFLTISLITMLAFKLSKKLDLRSSGETKKNKPLSQILGYTSAFAIMLAAYFFSLYVGVVVLEKVPHVQDDVATLFQARILARGHLSAPTPEPFAAFQHEMLVNRGQRWFSKYTLGHPILLVPFVWTGTEWMAGPLIGLLTQIVLFFLTKRLFGMGSALLSSALLAASPQFLFMSSSYMSHTSSLLWTVLYAYFLVCYYHKPRLSLAILAGIAIGMCGITRPFTGLLVALPSLGLIAAAVRKHGWKPNLSILGICLGAAPPVLFQLYFNQVLIGNPFKFAQQVYWPNDRLGFGDVGNFGGHTPLVGLHNTRLNLSELLPFLFGWPWWMALAFVPWAFAEKRNRGWNLWFFSTWLALVVGYFFWWFHGVMFGARFWYEGVFALVILTARGFQSMAAQSTRLAGHLGGPNPRFTLPANLSIAAVILLAFSFGTLPYIGRLLTSDYRTYNYFHGEVISAVEAAHLKNAVVFIPGKLFWTYYGGAFSQNSPWLDSTIVYAVDVDAETTAKVKAKFPARNYYIFRGKELSEF